MLDGFNFEHNPSKPGYGVSAARRRATEFGAIADAAIQPEDEQDDMPDKADWRDAPFFRGPDLEQSGSEEGEGVRLANPNTPEGLDEIEIQAEDSVIDTTYTYDVSRTHQGEVEVVVTEDHSAEFAQSEAYDQLRELQESIQLAADKVNAGTPLNDEDMDELQRLYGATKQTADPAETSPAQDSTEQIEVFSQPELTTFLKGLGSSATEVTRLYGEYLSAFPVEAERPPEVTLFINQLVTMQGKINHYKDVIDSRADGLTTDDSLGVSYDELQAFLAETDRKLANLDGALHESIRSQAAIEADVIPKPRRVPVAPIQTEREPQPEIPPQPKQESKIIDTDSLEWLQRLHGKELGDDIYRSQQNVRKMRQEKAEREAAAEVAVLNAEPEEQPPSAQSEEVETEVRSKFAGLNSLEWLQELHGEEVGADIYASRQNAERLRLQNVSAQQETAATESTPEPKNVIETEDAAGHDVETPEGLQSLVDDIKQHYAYIDENLQDPSKRELFILYRNQLDGLLQPKVQEGQPFTSVDVPQLTELIDQITALSDAAEKEVSGESALHSGPHDLSHVEQSLSTEAMVDQETQVEVESEKDPDLFAWADAKESPKEKTLAEELAVFGQASLEPDEGTESDSSFWSQMLSSDKRRKEFHPENEPEQKLSFENRTAPAESVAPHEELVMEPKPSASETKPASEPEIQPTPDLTEKPEVKSRVDIVSAEEKEEIEHEEEIARIIKSEVRRVENKEYSPMDKWFSDYQSPYRALSAENFDALRAQTTAGVGTKEYAKYKATLADKKVKYEMFNEWVKQFRDIDHFVPDTSGMTFKEVIDAYIRAQAES